MRHGYVKTNGGNRYKGYEYEIKDYREYEKVKSNIDKQLSDILSKIDQKLNHSVVRGSLVGQS